MSTMDHLPFPGMNEEQRSLLRRWMHAAADRETFLQRKATRTQDRVRHAIRANAFRDAYAELSGPG